MSKRPPQRPVTRSPAPEGSRLSAVHLEPETDYVLRFRARSSTVAARNFVSSKTVASGQNDTVVPVRPRGALPTTSSLPWAACSRACRAAARTW